MPTAACRAAAEWAGWICKNEGRAQRVQTALISRLCAEGSWTRSGPSCRNRQPLRHRASRFELLQTLLHREFDSLGVEHYLLALARVCHKAKRPAVAQTHVCDLHYALGAPELDVLMAPIELIRLAWRKVLGEEGGGDRSMPTLELARLFGSRTARSRWYRCCCGGSVS
jgi:hypothetical protein